MNEWKFEKLINEWKEGGIDANEWEEEFLDNLQDKDYDDLTERQIEKLGEIYDKHM